MFVVVIHKLHHRLLSMFEVAVMGEQCEQGGAEHTALGASGVEHRRGGGVRRQYPNCLRSVSVFTMCFFGYLKLTHCEVMRATARFSLLHPQFSSFK